MADHSEQLVDEVLVMDAQSGCAKAMEMLVRRWQKRFWRYAYRLTGRPEAAWEVTQESWLGIVRGIRRLHDPARFRAWAYRIVTNKAKDWIRKNARTPLARADELIARDDPDPHNGPDAMNDLHAILRRLPHRSRNVLTLYYLEEISVAEIAGILRVPKGTVKSRLHTARTEFKRLWQEIDETAQAKTSAMQKGETQ